MEKEALHRLLENLVTVFTFDKLTTVIGASSTAFKPFRDLKGELITSRYLYITDKYMHLV